jgi:hypothetical protein
MDGFHVPLTITGCGTFRMELFVSNMPFNLMSAEQFLRLLVGELSTQLPSCYAIIKRSEEEIF